MPHLTIRKIITSHVHLAPALDSGDTFGSHIDEQIESALENGEELLNFEIGFEPSEWNDMRAKHHDRLKAEGVDWETTARVKPPKTSR